ncbi:hypothetical protein BGZ80_004592 [Entomortierella chlamydospora]|uniref:Uncharacterized protein n=1 Tax=Entomortierella chlamydospora TaxID=101097 RepID=A0A9P6MLX1_9FUNG|nr:hypothetical protein BGZ80_004592 [Entomortierella chlamydospora]
MLGQHLAILHDKKKGAPVPMQSLHDCQENKAPPQVSIIHSSVKRFCEPSTSDGFSAQSKNARRSGSETLTTFKPKRGRPPRLGKSKVIDDESIYIFWRIKRRSQ